MRTFSKREQTYFERGIRFLAGVDEAGRGPLAGPVVAGAVIFPSDIDIEGIEDSKALSGSQRKNLCETIRSKAIASSIGVVSHQTIDEINILNASILAMHRALSSLAIKPDHVLVDGNRFHHATFPFTTIVKGDATCFTIAAASILAKQHRDELMLAFDAVYPNYHFGKHKGYPTREHIEAIRRYGYSPIHRRSFHVKLLSSQLSILDHYGFESGTRTAR